MSLVKLESLMKREARHLAKTEGVLLVVARLTPYSISRNDPEHGAESSMYSFRFPLHEKKYLVRKTSVSPEQSKYFTRGHDRAFHVSLFISLLHARHGCTDDVTHVQSQALSAYDAHEIRVPSVYDGDNGWIVGLHFSGKGFLTGVSLEHDPASNPELTADLEKDFVGKVCSAYRNGVKINLKDV